MPRSTRAATEHQDHAVSPNGREGPGTDHLLSLREIESRFPGEWILMHVLELDSYGEPLRGTVITHSTDRDQISEALAKQPPRGDPRHRGSYYIFCAPQPGDHRAAWEAAVDRFLQAAPNGPGA